MIWTILIAILAGAAAGWILRRGGRSPSARLVEEMYGRKVRLAEQERQQAIVELNANRVAMTTFDERFAALDARIAALSADLERARAAAGTAERDLARRESELAGLRGFVEEARRTEALALIQCAEALQEHEVAWVARVRAEEEAGARRSEAVELRERLLGLDDQGRGLASDLEARTAALAASRDEAARLGGELEAVRAGSARLEAELARLTALQGELDGVRRELLRREDSLAGVRAELDGARARIGELETLPGRLAALREELAARDGEHRAREVQLEQLWKERQESAVQGKETELAEERRRNEERLERLHALGLELERTRDRVRELQAACDGRVVEVGEQRQERERLEAELLEAKAEASKAEAVLGERAGRIAELEGTVRGKDVQLRELARLPRELEQAQGRTAKLEQELTRSQGRALELEGEVKAREREAQELRRDLARQEKELRAAEAAREKGAAALQERVAKLRELEGALREKAVRVRELEAGLRARPVEQRTIQPAPRALDDQRDDLQRIAGIGPVLEKKLQRLGLRTYRQIAALTKDEIDSLAERLGTSPERIRREGWIASARSAMRSGG